MSNENETINKAETRLAQAYNEQLGTSAALDDPFLNLLIEIVFALIDNCRNGGALFGRRGSLTGKQALERVKDPSRLQRLLIRRVVARELREREGFGAWRKYNGEAIVSSIIGAGSESSEQDLDELIALSKRVEQSFE